MIRIAAILHIIGLFLIVLGATMLIPLVYSAATGGVDAKPILWGALITAGTGAALFLGSRRPDSELSVREGVLLVTAVWAVVCLFGGLPFYFSPYFGSYTDAMFEAASGFTTTGATILADVEVLPGALQLWRCFSHWLGGMGIVLLGIAILPLLGTGGMHLYRAEFSGAKSEKLKPRITETALSLWKIYMALTLAEYVALRYAGLDRFEAACHSFSTLGTGGFSSRTASVAGFGSPLVEYIVIVFMVLAGINFTWHYRLWSERKIGGFFRDVEIRTYLMIIAVTTMVIGATLVFQTGYGPEHAARAALFQVTAITTTTGFVTEDYEQWMPLCQVLLLALMFVGGCTGSTAGGLKVSRFLLLRQVVYRQFRRIVEPRGVFAIRLGGSVIPEASVHSLLNLLYLAMVAFFAAAVVLSATCVDVLTSIAAVTASLFNIGPGSGD
ncbi:MAG: TrkH family potassium uptake protein, partial [bacterium]|nr:TrkH family potassium uptake protein [bacterium]